MGVLLMRLFTKVRRWDKSGPIMASCWRRKCTRRIRLVLRATRSSEIASSAKVRKEMGSLKLRYSWRPWVRIIKNFLMEPGADQLLEKNIFHSEFSFSGSRHQYTAT